MGLSRLLLEKVMVRLLVNYLTFPVIHKLQGSVLALTWRLTF